MDVFFWGGGWDFLLRALYGIDIHLAKWNNISPTWISLKILWISLTIHHHLGVQEEIGTPVRSPIFDQIHGTPLKLTEVCEILDLHILEIQFS